MGALESEEDLAMCGFGVEPMDSAYAVRWDKDPAAEPCDLGDIGEDGDGVWCKRHPEVLLTAEPKLWGIMTQWRLGLEGVPPEWIDTKSSYELDAFLVLHNAQVRKVTSRGET